MDTRRILKKIGVGLLGLMVVGLFILNIFQYQQIKKVSRNTNSETTANSASASPVTSDKEDIMQKKGVKSTALASKEKASAGGNDDDLNYQLDAAEEELDMVHNQLSAEQTKKAELKKAQLELQKKSMKDPSFKKYMRSSLDMQYGDLFKQLNLSPEKLEKFKDLLVDEMAAGQNIYIEMQLGNDTPTKEQQAEMRKRYEALNKEYETKKNELLGKNDFQTYQAYSERTGERYYVSNFMESLGSSEKMTETQKNNLIEAMYNESKNIRNENKVNDDSSESFSSSFDEKSIAKMMEFEDRRGEAYLKATQGLLTASQTEQFRTYLKQQRDMMESSMKMQALMNGTQSSQKSDDKTSK
jgi:hypothetical protein